MMVFTIMDDWLIRHFFQQPQDYIHRVVSSQIIIQPFYQALISVHVSPPVSQMGTPRYHLDMVCLPIILQFVGISNVCLRHQHTIDFYVIRTAAQPALHHPYRLFQFPHHTFTRFTARTIDDGIHILRLLIGSFFPTFVAVQTYYHHIRRVDINIDVPVCQKRAHTLQMFRIYGVVHRHGFHVSPDSSSCLSPKVVNQSILHHHQFNKSHSIY